MNPLPPRTIPSTSSLLGLQPQGYRLGCRGRGRQYICSHDAKLGTRARCGRPSRAAPGLRAVPPDDSETLPYRHRVYGLGFGNNSHFIKFEGFLKRRAELLLGLWVLQPAAARRHLFWELHVPSGNLGLHQVCCNMEGANRDSAPWFVGDCNQEGFAWNPKECQKAHLDCKRKNTSSVTTA